MSLLVHELLIGTGGGGNATSNIQTSSSNPVPIASVTVTHSNPNVQVAHIQQSRVVTITSSQSRLPTPEKGSRLAEALAGNPPYSYPSASQRFSRSQQVPNRNIVSHVLTTPGIPVAQAENLKSSKPIPSRQTYVLPFVLQDHNYGAPPPPTPPHSPPPSHQPPFAASSSSTPYSYKVHQIFPSTTTTTTTKTSPRSNTTQCVSQSKIQNQYPKVAPEQPVLTIGAVQISNSNATTVGNHTVASHIMASMPLHRQQFMPHPKVNVYPSPSITVPAPTSELISPQPAPPPSNGGQDTDEESRLSDRSSSVGPSGEETETAPEGEGEEQVQADDSITRCICNFTHDDGYMIQCDRCFVWQHVDCMEIDRNNIPDEYLCEACKPRVTDKNKARTLQVRRRQEIRAHLARVSSSDSDDNVVPQTRNKLSSGKSQDRKVLKKKKPKSSKDIKNNQKNTLSGNKTSIGNGPTNNVKPFQSLEDRESKPYVVKSRRRQSSLSGGHSTGDESPTTVTLSIEQLRSWIEDYEVAVTNHYSPELRAKVHAARINGISPEFRESTQGALLGHRCRVAPCYEAGPQSFEEKILIAATRLETGTAIIEYQGKYTLKSQWNPLILPQDLPYLPFVLQYNMQKEGLHVCVDARTYGNDARFARRSVDYNAEIRHVVERGSVHLYIVACKDIEEEEEIILPLETALCQQPVAHKSPSRVLSKIDTNENVKEESSKLISTAPQVRKNGVLQNKKNVRKPLLSLSLPQPLNRMSRRATSSDSYSCDDVNSPIQAVSPMKQRRASGCGGSRSPAKCNLKSPSKSPSKTPIEDSSSGESPQHQESPGSGEKDSHKMTREERKIAAYMKAFERMEKAAQRKQEMEKKKGEDKGKRHNLDDEDGKGSTDESTQRNSFERRKCKKTKGSPHKNSNDLSEDDNYGSSSEGERTKGFEGSAQGYSSPPISGFRFPKTKKALMNEWLNETINPVLHSSSFGSEVVTGVPTCYMRSPSTPLRKPGTPINSGPVTVKTGVVEMAGRSAKKRWLRQAIIDETGPPPPPPHTGPPNLCSSPNSRPDSPVAGGDYITPLKKRRLARESMSSEQSNTPPSTPLHSGIEEKFNEEMELDHTSDVENFDPEEDNKDQVKLEAGKHHGISVGDVKKEDCDLKQDNPEDTKPDRLTINISQINVAVKSEPQEESDSETKEKLKPFCSVKVENNLQKFEFEDKEENGEVDNTGPKCSIAESDEIRNCLSTSSTDENDEKEDEIVQKKNKILSKSLKASVRKGRKKSKKDKVMRYNNLDKNRNMQRKRVLTSPKIKRKKSKPNKLKTKDEKSKNKNKTDSKSNFKSNINHTKSKSPEKRVKDNTSVSSYCDSATGNERQGPKTPEGTPPETPVKLDSKSKFCPNLPEDITDGLSNFGHGNLIHSVEARSKSVDDVKVKICFDQSMEYNIPDTEALKTVIAEGMNSKCEPVREITINNSDHKKETVNLHPTATFCKSKDESNQDDLKTEASSTINKECTDKTQSASSTKYAVKPAAVKRKLSILEYRKRKSVSCEREQKEESNCHNVAITSEVYVDNAASSTVDERIKSYTVQDSSQIDSFSSLDDSSSINFNSLPANLPLDSANRLDKGKVETSGGAMLSPSKTNSKDVKWNAAPTLLEQQRENLTARLRREFGLCLPEDNQLKLKLGEQSMKNKWIELDKRYGFSGKKNFPGAIGTSSCAAVGPILQVASHSTFKSPPPARLLSLGTPETKCPLQRSESGRSFYAPELKPSVPLPPTFEKLSSVKLLSECESSELGDSDANNLSLKLKMPISLRSPIDAHNRRTRCDSESKSESS